MKKQVQLLLCIVTGMLAVSSSNLKAEDKNIIDIAVAKGNFKILIKILQATGLDKKFNRSKPITLFAPDDEAFMKLPKEIRQKMMKPENKEYLMSILKYHMVIGNVSISDAISRKKVDTLHGENLYAQFKNASMYFNKARVKASSIKASNGMIHVIDSVLVPNKIKAKKPSENKGQALSKKLMEDAIKVGSVIYDDGNKSGCVAIYKFVVEAIVDLKSEAFDEDDIKSMQKVLDEVNQSKDSKENAWLLRRVMNKMLLKLEK